MQQGGKVYQYYKDLPSWAKGVSVVGVLLVGFIVGRKIYMTIVKSQQEKRNREYLRDVDSDISKNQQSGVKPSFSDSNYMSFANTIYNSMRYCVGDDYGSVESTMKKMNNDLDVAKLIKAFGVRQDYCFGIPSGDPMDLFTYVRKELGNDYAGITDYRVKHIMDDWANKGITYKI